MIILPTNNSFIHSFLENSFQFFSVDILLLWRLTQEAERFSTYRKAGSSIAGPSSLCLCAYVLKCLWQDRVPQIKT